MCCAVTEIDAYGITEEEKTKILNLITDNIPLGFESRKHSLGYKMFKSACGDKELDKKVNDKIFKQLGTLGSGR